MKTHKTVALIVAAGEGTRAGEGLPKQYRQVRGKPLLLHGIELFLAHPSIERVVVMIHEEHLKYYASLGGSLPQAVTGGATRQESVRKGLGALRKYTPSQVLIHDAARPLADSALIDRVVEGLERFQAVIPVTPVTDTLKTIERGKVVSIDRSKLQRAQTPQGFDFALICSLHEKYARREATDDAMLAEWAGIKVGFVPGDERNLKITTALDFKIAEAL